jgi:hypothetical protein
MVHARLEETQVGGTMRYPGRLIALSLAAGLMGALSASVPFLDSDRGEEGAWLILGGMAALIGFTAAATLTLNLRRMRRLNDGQGVVARWQVDPAIWSAFVRGDREAEREGRKLNNAIRFRDRAAAPVQVLVGDDCLQVDGDFHKVALAELTGAALSAGPPKILELRFVTPRPQRSDLHYALRFAVAFGAETAAQAVIDHYDRRYREKYGAR